MHLKNWSLIYRDQRTAAIAPAYDFVSTVPYIPGDPMALKLSRTREFTALDADELSHFAAKAALPKHLVLDTARKTVALFHQEWQAERAHLPMTTQVREAIDSHIGTVPLARAGW